DRELVVVFAAGDRVARRRDPLGESRLEAAELAVDERRRRLDPAQPAHDRDRHPLARHRKVLYRLRRLTAPQLLSQLCPPCEFAAPAYSAARFTRVEALAEGAQESRGERSAAGAVAGGGGEAAQQVGVDAVRAGGAALGGADQIAEPQSSGASRLGSGFAVEPRRGAHHRRPHGGEVASLLVLDQAAADRRAATKLHLTGCALQRCEIGPWPFQTIN